jgi:type II restriction enzyme
MANSNQSVRLTAQHVLSRGVTGIFGEIARNHDLNVAEVSQLLVKKLSNDYPTLQFRHRTGVTKIEINNALQKIDSDLGQTLFVSNSGIRPDGGLIEVLDDLGEWRIVVVSEAKHQGKDIENIRAGKLVGANIDQDLMSAGNAIERSHKNISEIANLMLGEAHFPYVLFLEGSNFLTETVTVARPDGRLVVLHHNSGGLNRLDRLTSANYGLPINTNLCENKLVAYKDKAIMLQAASIFTQGDGERWDSEKMMEIMLDVANTSLKALASDLFDQITEQNT